jgi:hypothetical protein
MKKSIGLCGVIALAFIPLMAQAVMLRPLAGINAEFGGAKLLTVTYTDGSTSDVMAGQGFTAFGGVALQGLVDLNPLTVDLQVTLGVKYSTIQQASNANVDFFRFPAELLMMGHWMGLRFGAGPTYHFGNSISGSGLLSGANANFDNALGVVAQVDYTFAEHWNLGLRYTSISYQDPSLGIGKTDAGNFGVEASYFFL